MTHLSSPTRKPQTPKSVLGSLVVLAIVLAAVAAAQTGVDAIFVTLDGDVVSGMTEHGYDVHGELETSLDQRGILTTRTLDVLDRVTQVSWSGDPSRTVDYTWDDPLVDYSLGRLTRISRGATSVDYAYDVFGRVTRDGDLTYGYDGNGKCMSIMDSSGAYCAGIPGSPSLQCSPPSTQQPKVPLRQCCGNTTP